MTYQVLARKWRPRSFDTLVGQDHVVRALTHALDSQRLHHAWLFTGTRGVGKTTLSRILAKALNCEKGISASPCGTCRSCVEIDQGRFVDYVELDAASNRGVDEMTQLLEQAIYAPSAARFKVYMIDEVHMLTGHAFNAMLKTLEEPPAHLKFILATTDPQKIPVTVLSRCLQFNLKQMTVPAIEQHLNDILDQEQIQAEGPALRLLAQAAHGSMRDALSLTDQAISYSAGDISTEAVQGMLGTIDQAHLVQLIDAVLQHDARAVVQLADDMQLRGLSFSAALADLAVLLSRIAIQQRVPDALPPDETNRAAIERLATQLSPDHVQLFYSVVVHSRDELALAPDECAGFIMTALRLLALMPAGPAPAIEQPVTKAVPKSEPATEQSEAKARVESNPVAPVSPQITPPIPTAESKSPQTEVKSDAASTRSGIQPPIIERGSSQSTPAAAPIDPPGKKASIASAVAQPSASEDLPPWETETTLPPVQTHNNIAQDKPVPASDHQGQPPALATVEPTQQEAPADDGPPLDDEYDSISRHEYDADFSTGDNENGQIAPPDQAIQQAVAALALPEKTTVLQPQQMSASQWATLAPTLALSGWAAELAQQAEWVECNGNQITLRVAIRSADDSQAKSRINTILNEYFGEVVVLNIEYGDTGDETAYALAEAERAEKQANAENDAQHNAFIQALQTQFDARLLVESIRAK